jgi:alpha-tubulin suppressor-like RCC1 family protein
MHCIILFKDGQLGGFGCNKAGQLGFQINNQRINEVCINKKFLNDNYEILDIGAGNNFSLILVRQGSENKLFKFGIKQEDRLVDESFDRLKIINIVDIEYHRIKKIESIFVFDERSLFLTQDKKLYRLTNNSFKEYVDLSRIMIRSINIGLRHCLILDGI